MLRHITRQEIERHMAEKSPMTLVEALPEKYYREGHLPGAVHVPFDQPQEIGQSAGGHSRSFLPLIGSSGS